MPNRPSVLTDYDPDSILVACCGFDLHRNLEDAQKLWSKSWWTSLRCVKPARIYKDVFLLQHIYLHIYIHTKTYVHTYIYIYIYCILCSTCHNLYPRDLRIIKNKECSVAANLFLNGDIGEHTWRFMSCYK